VIHEHGQARPVLLQAGQQSFALFGRHVPGEVALGIERWFAARLSTGRQIGSARRNRNPTPISLPKRQDRRPVSVCGEEAGEPGFACLLAGLGVRELSLSPGRAARVRDALRGVRCQDAEELAHKALGCSSAEEVRWLKPSVTGLW
jgi:PEP-utilizing family enzyme